MPFEFEVLILKAIELAEKIVSASNLCVDLDTTLPEVENFMRLVNVVAKQASINEENMEVFQKYHKRLSSLYDKIDQYLLVQRQQLCNELKIHHKNHDAIRSYTGE